MLEIRKKTAFIKKNNMTIIYKFFKYFTIHRNKTNRAVAFSCGPLPNNFKYKRNSWGFPTIWKTRFHHIYIEEFS